MMTYVVFFYCPLVLIQAASTAIRYYQYLPISILKLNCQTHLHCCCCCYWQRDWILSRLIDWLEDSGVFEVFYLLAAGCSLLVLWKPLQPWFFMLNQIWSWLWAPVPIPIEFPCIQYTYPPPGCECVYRKVAYSLTDNIVFLFTGRESIRIILLRVRVFEDMLRFKRLLILINNLTNPNLTQNYHSKHSLLSQ